MATSITTEFLMTRALEAGATEAEVEAVMDATIAIVQGVLLDWAVHGGPGVDTSEQPTTSRALDLVFAGLAVEKGWV